MRGEVKSSPSGRISKPAVTAGKDRHRGRNGIGCLQIPQGHRQHLSSILSVSTIHKGEGMKRFIANWLLSWADLVDTIMEILTLGLVLSTDVAHVVLRTAEEELYRAGWMWDWRNNSDG